MKSAAFNLAFKVHRNELPFPEGLLKSVEAKAQEDFIEALNSLGGETKYDVNKLDQLIGEAQQGATKKGGRKKVNLEALEEEIKQLKKQRNEYNESILTYRSKIGSLHPRIIPGINSGLIAIVGSVIMAILFILNLGLITLIMLAVTIGTAIFTLAQDLDILKKQQADIAQKKMNALSEIKIFETRVEELTEKINEKRSALRAAQEDDASEENTSSKAPDAEPSPPIAASPSDDNS